MMNDDGRYKLVMTPYAATSRNADSQYLCAGPCSLSIGMTVLARFSTDIWLCPAWLP